MKIIKEEKWQKETYYTLEFFSIDDMHEFSFPCNKDGKLLKDKMVDAAIDNYNLCINTPERFKNPGGNIVKHEIEYKEPAVGECSCGKKLEMLSHYLGALQCPKCKKWYNVWGQELLPPECWE